jgi:hypothetical protein
MGQPINLENLIDHSGGWDWKNAHVAQAYLEPTGFDTKKSIAVQDIVESGTVLVAAGPADLDRAVEMGGVTGTGSDGYRIVPIGLIEGVQISMNKPLSRIFEIGSILSYIIPGRALGGISLSRVFFDGPSLLKAIYMGEVKADAADEKWKYAKFVSSQFVTGTDQDAYQQFAHIGSGQLAINLASTFFNQPVGLAFYFKDQQSDTVSQVYFEGCQVSSHNLGISANMNVLTESISMEFIRCRPIITSATWNYKYPQDKGRKMVDLNVVSAMSNQPTRT